jgi:hypothetical protein
MAPTPSTTRVVMEHKELQLRAMCRPLVEEERRGQAVMGGSGCLAAQHPVRTHIQAIFCNRTRDWGKTDKGWRKFGRLLKIFNDHIRVLNAIIQTRGSKIAASDTRGGGLTLRTTVVRDAPPDPETGEIPVDPLTGKPKKISVPEDILL